MLQKKYKILYDLSFAHRSMGYGGIPQDARLLFSGLTESNTLDINGLIRPHHRSFYLHKDLNTILSQSILLGPFLENRVNQRSFIEKILEKMLSPRYANAYKSLTYNNKKYKNFIKIREDMFFDMLWRGHFASTLPCSKRPSLEKLNYYLSPLGGDKIVFRAIYNLKQPRLNTQDFDFIFFQDARPLRVSPNTIKMSRYHDGLQIKSSDTMQIMQPIIHDAVIRGSEKDTIFVCNSDSARHDLSQISPRAAEQARIIPYFIPQMHRLTADADAILMIAKARISKHTLASKNIEAETQCLKKWFHSSDNSQNPPRYIISLATLEPRKNFISLINAWLRLRYQTKQDIKLMIVGSPGWLYEPILAAMRPFVASGDLLHLEKVGQFELPYLYSAASCFVFPSYGEGFGLPITEAMQCGCPTIVSDISAHRYSAGNAAIYCNPYDEEDMANKIQSILFPSSVQIIEELVDKGYENVKRFSVDSLLPQWENLFDELYHNHKAC